MEVVDLEKVHDSTKAYNLRNSIKTFMENYRFYRGKIQGKRRGTPKKLFIYVYTNIQPHPMNTKNYIDADDLEVQVKSTKEAEHNLTIAELNQYYCENRKNQTQVSTFHFHNKQTSRTLQVK